MENHTVHESKLHICLNMVSSRLEPWPPRDSRPCWNAVQPCVSSAILPKSLCRGSPNEHALVPSTVADLEELAKPIQKKEMYQIYERLQKSYQNHLFNFVSTGEMLNDNVWLHCTPLASCGVIKCKVAWCCCLRLNRYTPNVFVCP